MNDYEAKQERRRERLERASERAAREADSRHRASRAATAGIPFGQPILVGHHSEKRHRAAVDRSWNHLGKAVEAGERSKALAARAAAVGTGGISQDDPDAVEKLRERLAELEAQREGMKKANKAYQAARKLGVASKPLDEIPVEALEKIAKVSGLPIGDRALVAAVTWVPNYSFERGPFIGWPLQNLGGNIRRIEGRIEQLERRGKERAEMLEQGLQGTETVVGEIRVVENIEANRLQVFFPGKPSYDVRTKLKRNGFRWAPSEGAWQRHINAYARSIAVQIASEIGLAARSNAPGAALAQPEETQSQ